MGNSHSVRQEKDHGMYRFKSDQYSKVGDLATSKAVTIVTVIVPKITDLGSSKSIQYGKHG